MIGGVHVGTHRLMEGIYKDAVEMGLSAMIYIKSFIKMVSSINKLIR
jgi:hypothetical protein